MKTISIFSILLALLVLPMSGMSLTTLSDQGPDSNEPALNNAVELPTILPDLKVSTIATPGGLKKGSCNKVRVMVTNSQMAGVSEQIPVLLFISQQGQTPTSYVGYTSAGIGANDNYGQPVWFHNLPIGATGQVTIKAIVNADFDVEESVFNNNDKIKTFNVVGHCPGTSSGSSSGSSTSSSSSNSSSNSSSSSSSNSKSGSVKGGKINYTLMAYNSRTSRGRKKAPVAKAAVSLTSGRAKYTGMTDAHGKVQIAVPPGYYTIKISKRGCRTVAKKHRVSGKSAAIGISCR